jgi:hypothetical protein
MKAYLNPTDKIPDDPGYTLLYNGTLRKHNNFAVEVKKAFDPINFTILKLIFEKNS